VNAGRLEVAPYPADKFAIPRSPKTDTPDHTHQWFQSIIGSVESVENRFSTMREKLAAEMRLKLAKMNANK